MLFRSKFQFEEEAIVISEVEEGADEYSCVQTPAPIVTYIGDTSDEEEAMAPKTVFEFKGAYEKQKQGALSSG